MSKHTQRVAKALELSAALKAYRKAGQLMISDKIRADDLEPEQIAELVALFDPWKPNTAYDVGNLVTHDGVLYEVIQAHTWQLHPPPDVPALFVAKSLPGVISEWIQPAGAHDAYHTGDLVLFNGQVWISVVDNNVWAPGVYGWEVV